VRGPRAAAGLAALLAFGLATSCGRERGAGNGHDLDAGTQPLEDAGDPIVNGAGRALAVVETIDAIAINHAILARWRSADPAVGALAEERIVAFSALGDRARALAASRRDLAPIDSGWTRALELEAWSRREALVAATGPEFDRLWSAARDATDAAALDVIEAQVLPALLDADVRELVIAARETLVAVGRDQSPIGTPVSRWSSCTALRTASTSGCSNP
jgi:predicted outer membrane protein